MKTLQLKAMATHAGQKDVRYHLNGIRIHRKHIVATDGHRIAVYPSGFELPELEDDAEAYLIPQGIIATLNKKQPDFTITQDGVLVCGNMTVKLERTSRLDYLRVFGKGALPDYDYNGDLMPLNAKYLLEAGKLAAQFADNRIVIHRLKVGMVEARTADGSPASVVLTHSPLFIGIMPFKESDK